MVLNPRYGALGLFVLPYFVFIELLAPVVEIVGLLAVALGLAWGVVDIPFAALFVAVAYGFSLVLTAFTLALEEWTYRGYGRLSDRLYLMAVALIEGLGYRQLTALWRLRGLARYGRAGREWGTMTRRGFTGETDPSERMFV
jgi:hypothetical protein